MKVVIDHIADETENSAFRSIPRMNEHLSNIT